MFRIETFRNECANVSTETELREKIKRSVQDTSGMKFVSVVLI